MEGDEQEGARLDPELGGAPGGAEAALERDQGVDHRVADEVHPLLGDPLGAQVLDRLVAVEEEVLRRGVGDDPVDLLGHRAVEAAQAGLDVGDRDRSLGRGQRRRQGRVDVAGDDHQVGPLLEPGPAPAAPSPAPSAAAWLPEPTSSMWSGAGTPELLEEDLGHQPVVVLAGVDDRVAPSGSRARSAAITGAVLTKFGRVPTT